MRINYQELPDSHLINYYGFLVGKVYKVLPMIESGNVDFAKYLKSLQREIIGNMRLVDNLKYDGYFMALLNKIQFLISETYTHEECRATVFECIDLVKKVSNEYGCDENG